MVTARLRLLVHHTRSWASRQHNLPNGKADFAARKIPCFQVLSGPIGRFLDPTLDTHQRFSRTASIRIARPLIGKDRI